MYLALGYSCCGRALVFDARMLASNFEAIEDAMIISRTEGQTEPTRKCSGVGRPATFWSSAYMQATPKHDCQVNHLLVTRYIKFLGIEEPRPD